MLAFPINRLTISNGLFLYRTVYIYITKIRGNFWENFMNIFMTSSAPFIYMSVFFIEHIATGVFKWFFFSFFVFQFSILIVQNVKVSANYLKISNIKEMNQFFMFFNFISLHLMMIKMLVV